MTTLSKESDLTPQQFENIEYQDKPVSRHAGRKATITQQELFQATLNLIGSEKVFHL